MKSSWVYVNPNFKVPDLNGNSVVHAAASLGEHKIVLALGHMRCDVNQKNIDGDTAMHLAAQNDQAGCIEALLKHEAKTNIKNKFK